MQGHVTGTIQEDGSIHLTIANLVPQETPRPRTIEESGANPEMIRRINARVPGPIDTLGFIGGAVAQLVPLESMELLAGPLMDKLRQKYGRFGDVAYLTMVRNTAANAIWNTAEPSGGMAECANLVLDQLKEGCELGVYNDDGWCRLTLPSELAAFQPEFDEEQRFWWNIVNPGFPVGHNGTIEVLPFGHDSRNGQPGIWKCGPVGDISFTIVTKVNLTGDSFRFLDTESRPGNPAKNEPAWVPLRRKVMAIVPRDGRNPLMLELDPEGRLHSGGLHVVIEGENRQYVISHLSEVVIDALGWFNDPRS